MGRSPKVELTFLGWFAGLPRAVSFALPCLLQLALPDEGLVLESTPWDHLQFLSFTHSVVFFLYISLYPLLSHF